MKNKQQQFGDKLNINYKTQIDNYLRTKSVTLTPQGLNNALGIDRKFVYDCRRRNTPWRIKFIKEYDKARSTISTHMLNKSLVTPQLIYEHWRKSHPHEFDIETENSNKSNINITLENIRPINHE